MNLTSRIVNQSIPALLLISLLDGPAAAITTSQGQAWDFEPDAWTRGNDANTSYFGWDALETAGKPFHGALRILDDATPDLGGATTAPGTRIYQGANGIVDPSPTANGHLSGSGNYYSFFDVANDTITATAPASGAGGYTTIVLQVIGSIGGPGGDPSLSDLVFTMDNSVDTWTLDKHLHGRNALGIGLHWVEWWAPGDNLTFSIKMTSSELHRAIDAFQIDAFWTDGSGPALNAIQVIPEPASGVLAIGGAVVGLALVRRRAR